MYSYTYISAYILFLLAVATTTRTSNPGGGRSFHNVEANSSGRGRGGGGGGNTNTPSIPRSTNSRHAASQQSLLDHPGQTSEDYHDTYIPPWNPSKKIDTDGFLVHSYRCIPGEWESDCPVGGRYADLRVKRRFLFGAHHARKRAAYEAEVARRRGSSSGSGSGSSTRLYAHPPGGGSGSSSSSSSSTSTTYPPTTSWGLRKSSITTPHSPNSGHNTAMSIHPGGSSIGSTLTRRHPDYDTIDRRSTTLTCLVRQVPGDGNCLFHSVAATLSHAVNGTHVDMRNTTHLRTTSALLRRRAVQCLSQRKRRVLFLQGRECLKAEELVEAAAAQYNISAEEYCDLMSRESYWGGGPEIVALCNVLRRPIHVYELCADDGGRYRHGGGGDDTSSRGRRVGRKSKNRRGDNDNNVSNNNDNAPRHKDSGRQSRNSDGGHHHQNQPREFSLRRMACFGSPKFDRREPLHILSADSRFPDITPGRQLSSGNHFLALFPYESSSLSTQNTGRN